MRCDYALSPEVKSLVYDPPLLNLSQDFKDAV